MSSFAPSPGPMHLGRDASNYKIALVLRRWEEQVPDIKVIVNDGSSVRRLIGRFPDPAGLRACCPAGPTGFGYMVATIGA